MSLRDQTEFLNEQVAIYEQEARELREELEALRRFKYEHSHNADEIR